jgi:hypothetical protein
VVKENLPVETVVIQRVNHEGVANSTLVFKIPPSVAEHHMICEVLKAIRRDYPGAWYSVLEWYRDEQQQLQRARIGQQVPALLKPEEGAAAIEKIKKVTAESLGLPTPDSLGDVPL